MHLKSSYVQRAGHEVVEEITEIPTTPPPRIQERTVFEPAGPPQVIRRTIRVPPRSGGYGGYQQQQQQGASFASNVGQVSSNLMSAGSYGNVQQATGNYQQYRGTASTGYGGYGSVGGGYGSAGGSYGSYGGGYQQQQGFGYGGYQSRPAAPFAGIPGANCFYV